MPKVHLVPASCLHLTAWKDLLDQVSHWNKTKPTVFNHV